VIKMAEKAQDDVMIENRLKSSDALRLEFWTALLKEMAKKSELFKNISPKKIIGSVQVRAYRERLLHSLF